ncbi:MAG: hypothetical protein IJM40_01270 [Synergistaceae bacterium]|nr:hypothetical protein [Synergistaceae bacterium]
MRKILALIFLLLILIAPASAKVYIAEPLLVQQPAYAGMNFYVFRPYNMPKDWYVTFDGYPVKKNKDGVWVYGTSNGPNLTPTSYIVGSVVPSMAGLTPWVQQAQISALRKLPNAEMTSARVTQGSPSAKFLANGQTHSTYIPDWTYNYKFMAIGNWRDSVDRIGVLRKPAVPVAWKGNSPKILYIWTGQTWHQVLVRDRPASTLRGKFYELNKLVKSQSSKVNFKWYADDTPALAQQTSAWGYYWMGEIDIIK